MNIAKFAVSVRLTSRPSAVRLTSTAGPPASPPAAFSEPTICAFVSASSLAASALAFSACSLAAFFGMSTGTAAGVIAATASSSGSSDGGGEGGANGSRNWSPPRRPSTGARLTCASRGTSPGPFAAAISAKAA